MGKFLINCRYTPKPNGVRVSKNVEVYANNVEDAIKQLKCDEPDVNIISVESCWDWEKGFVHGYVAALCYLLQSQGATASTRTLWESLKSKSYGTIEILKGYDVPQKQLEIIESFWIELN